MTQRSLDILTRALNAQKTAADIGKVNSAVSGLGRTAQASGNPLNSAFGAISAGASRAGSALGHAAGQIKGLVTGPLGMIGLAGGAVSLGGALVSSVHKIEEFGAGLEKVQMLTGETALASGALLIQFQKFGLGADDVTRIAGFAEKTLGKLNDTMTAGKNPVSKLAELDKQYGLQLIDSKGKVVDFSTTLSQLATYYDSGASASQKAYLASQIFGRGYTQMLPILNEGSAGLRQAAADAASLGLGSADTVAQLAKFHDQMHALENQTNLLQLSIGTVLLPTLIDLSTAATTFVTDHRSDIVTFFKNAVAAGKQVGGVFLDVGRSILGLWNSIPPEMRDLVIKGVAVDRTFKFLFGFDPAKALLSGIGSAISGGLGKAVGSGLVSAGIGKAFVQPVFVTNPGFGGAGGLPGGGAATAATAAGGGLSLGGLVGGVAAAAVPIVAAEFVLGTSTSAQRAQESYNARVATAQARGIPTANVPVLGDRAGGPIDPMAAFLAAQKSKSSLSGKAIDDVIAKAPNIGHAAQALLSPAALKAANAEVKSATDAVAQDVRESTRLNNQAQVTASASVTAAIVTMQNAVVAALGKLKLNVTAAAVTNAQTAVKRTGGSATVRAF